MSPDASLQARFQELGVAMRDQVRAGEIACAWVQSEHSDFVRLNQGRIRQAGTVLREQVTLRLVEGARQALMTITLADAISAQVRDALAALRACLVDSEDDPLLDICLEAGVSADAGEAIPDRFAIHAVLDVLTDAIPSALARRSTNHPQALPGDLVGFVAGGVVARGFCSTVGASRWFERFSIALDASIHLPVDPITGDRRAVKLGWSGERVDAEAIRAALARARLEAVILQRPARRLGPGEYRALLRPRAFADLLSMLDWGGYSARAHCSGQSPLARLRSGQARFSPLLSIREDLAAGFAPAFQAEGYVRPTRCDLILNGQFADWLVSPATAREFNLKGNAANASETPESLVVGSGTLAEAQALAHLDTGVLLSNLWYLNFSDRDACRVTGMTRFACLWVQDGQPVAPIEAMRFDDSLFDMLGESGLQALGAQAERMPNLDTWEGRSTGGIEAPCALLRRLRFAL
jgi:predicted Zn-dependent protease